MQRQPCLGVVIAHDGVVHNGVVHDGVAHDGVVHDVAEPMQAEIGEGEIWRRGDIIHVAIFADYITDVIVVVDGLVVVDGR